MWKLEGFIPVPNQITMKRYDWYIDLPSFEKAKAEAYKRGARNIFRISEVETPYPITQLNK